MKDEMAPRGTPEARREAVIEFYRLVGTNRPPEWSGHTMAIHFGLETEEPFSIEESLLETNRELARRAQIQPGTRVLDAGCGIGGSSIWMARELGAVATGISLVPEQIAQAQRAARETETRNVSFIEGDFFATGLPKGSFDVVWNLESLCHCDGIEAYFRHAHELLSEGGRIACLDVFRAEHQSTSLEDLREGGAFGELHRPSEIATMLERAGFVDVEVVDLRARALRSVSVLRESAYQAWLHHRLRAALVGSSEVLAKHAKASLACADAVLSGALTYAYVGARRG